MYRYKLPFIKVSKAFKSWLQVETTRLSVREKSVR